MDRDLRRSWLVEPDQAALSRAHRLLRSDPKKAVIEMRALAERGSIMSMLYVGQAYRRGTGTDVDSRTAEKWYRRAADAGSLSAYYFLGRLYLVEKRYDEARDVFEYASERNYAPATHFLGRMHFAGKGVPKDPEKGEQLLKCAASAGSVYAKAGLAQFLIRRHSSPRSTLRGMRLCIEALFQFLLVLLTEGLTSDRLR